MSAVDSSSDQTLSECKDYINIILERCERNESGKWPQNVVILGAPGCGKSSFINSLAGSLSQDKWVDYTEVDSEDEDRPDSGHISVHRRCCLQDHPLYTDVLLPTLIRMPGLSEDAAGGRMSKFLHLLFYGHVKNLAEASQVYSDCSRTWEDLMDMYSTVYDNMKVDSVIFVASAVDEKLPFRLMNCVLSSARPLPNPQGFTRQIPIYGVLTKFDKIDDSNREQFEERKEEFMRALDLHEGRVLCCSNYCDETDPDRKRLHGVLASIDLPILKLFAEVCERRPPAVHQEDKTLEDFLAHLRYSWQAVVASLTVALVTFLAVFFLLWTFLSSEQDPELRKKCKTGDPNVSPMCEVIVTSSLEAASATAVLAIIGFWACRLF